VRVLGGILTLAVLAAAQAPSDKGHEVVAVFGGSGAWGALPEWRQRDILRRYERFRRLPKEEKAEIRRRGLKEFLYKPGKRFELPRPLQEEIGRLPREVRSLAAKLAVLRLRHLRFDRHLSLVPFEQRRPLFFRLFPKRFDREKARAARKELNKYASRAMIRRILPLVRKQEERVGRKLTKQEKAKIVHRVAKQEEQRIIEQTRRELLRFQTRSPKRIRRSLEKEGFALLETLRLMATPRQRELVRWALRPERCPLIDPVHLAGKQPADPAARRLWQRDVRVLGRIDLLSEAEFPPGMVLHLAASNSTSDFLRAIRAFRPSR